MSTPTLERCPFCGSHQVTIRSFPIRLEDGPVLSTFRIICNTCGSEGPPITTSPTKRLFSAPHEATMRWNKRDLGIPTDQQMAWLRQFISNVNAIAEEKMIKTGKLEGSHYAAMVTEADRLGLLRKGQWP